MVPVSALAAAASDAGLVRAALSGRVTALRARTSALAAPLSDEDMGAQTMADVSPAKWHLAHTSWFWETFLLEPHLPGYAAFDPRFAYLFNSYYEALGARQPRAARGHITRPGAAHVRAYRAHVDSALARFLEVCGEDVLAGLAPLIETGIAHEEQHQELLLTDIKHVLSVNPFNEAYSHATPPPAVGEDGPDWLEYAGGLDRFGAGEDGFSFDNEGPAHTAWLPPFALASRCVTNAAYAEFIADRGYETPSLWLSDGWARIQDQNRQAPFYWRGAPGEWREFTLHGERDIDPAAPVSHLDYFEASAFAEWTGYRLPEEREWELAARQSDPASARAMAPDGWLHPVQADQGSLFGGVWQWTRSAYAPYPGYRAQPGAIGEYNGKFMCGQFVLKGGSALTPPGHVRASYRNFFPPAAQWQMTGLRLARDA